MSKTCFKCKTSKPLDEFYKHPQMSDGRINKCKACAKQDVRKRYMLVGGRPEYERMRSQRPERKAAAREYQRKRRAAAPEKSTARNAVSNALRDKRLAKKPCENCGTSERIQAHHDDYSRPLDVEWLCFKCHREVAHGQRVRAA